MRTAKHVRHSNKHSTGSIRACPVCDGEDSILNTLVDCAVPSFLWNLYALMLTDIAMLLTLDDRFKIMGIFDYKNIKKLEIQGASRPSF